jgi:hypothetical protein
VKPRILTLIFGLILLAPAVFAQSSDEQNLCPEKSAQVQAEGKTLIPQCTQTWFGKALTADFQPVITHGPTAPVSSIKSNVDGTPFYQNALEKFYGLRNLQYFATAPTKMYLQGKSTPETGATLLEKFAAATKPIDSAVSEYASTTLTDKNQYKGLSEASGVCMIWSAWSLDPEVQAMMKTVKDGILCSGVPFTKAELKELITTVYPDPYANHNLDRRDLKGYYDPKNAPVDASVKSYTAIPADIEDANLAISKLGTFGEGSGFTPDGLVSMAAAAKAKGQSLIIDLDPGTLDVWNQPVEALVDVPYLDNSMTAADLNAYLKADDLSASTQVGVDVRNQIKLAEANLGYQALHGDQSVSRYLRDLEATAEGGTYPSRMALVDQVNELKRIQGRLVQAKYLAVAQNHVVKHRIFMQYGKEGRFAENNDNEPSVTRELDYVSVNGRAGWQPPTRKLSAVCTDGNVGKRVLADRDYGLVDNDLNRECGKFARDHLDHEVATGAFPPKTMNIYLNPHGDARFGAGEGQKRQAYNRLRDMILHCDDGRQGSFHGAALFMDSLKNAVATNSFTPASIANLKAQYANVKDFLDDEYNADGSVNPNNFVKNTIIEAAQSSGGDPNRFYNLKTLYYSLFKQ